ncbi:hypothetical protein D910_08051 [Dendroctonus ponderosae]|uniref:Uncharacterized protein n=1 Tax=Dendroctonus ponderosae TaxID=77166 RepID=U4U9U2_DENPD|nr:hypothetical protein D910_08051 [Dendroctonus ponderosae]
MQKRANSSELFSDLATAARLVSWPDQADRVSRVQQCTKALDQRRSGGHHEALRAEGQRCPGAGAGCGVENGGKLAGSDQCDPGAAVRLSAGRAGPHWDSLPDDRSGTNAGQAPEIHRETLQRAPRPKPKTCNGNEKRPRCNTGDKTASRGPSEQENDNRKTASEYFDLVALHLPIILRLCFACPFGRVREKCRSILELVRKRELPAPVPMVLGPSSFIQPSQLPFMGTCNEKVSVALRSEKTVS